MLSNIVFIVFAIGGILVSLFVNVLVAQLCSNIYLAMFLAPTCAFGAFVLCLIPLWLYMAFFDIDVNWFDVGEPG